MADFRGRSALLYVGKQSDFTTAATVQRLIHYYSARRNPGVGGFMEDERLGVAEHNAYDVQAPAPDLPSPSFELVTPACMAQSGWLLEALFGTVSPAGAGPYTRDHVTGASTLPILSVVQPMAASSDFRRVLGWRPNRFAYDIRRAGGYGRFTFSGPARDVTKLSSFTPGTVPAALTPAVLRQRAAAVTWDSVAASLTGFGFDYVRDMDLNEDLSDSDLPPGFEPGTGRLTGTLEARYATSALYDDAVAAHTQTPVALVATLTVDANNALTVTVPRARLEPSEPAVEGGGRILQRYNWRAEIGAAAPMATFQLKNSVATYTWS